MATPPFAPFAPKRILALGVTWKGHAQETGEKISVDGPPVFTRDLASIASDGRVLIPSRRRIVRSLDAIEPGVGSELARRHPTFPVLLDYEIELGFVVLQNGRTSWFLANDVTVRTVQILGEGMTRRMDFWSAAKSFPSTLLVGPTLLESEEIPDLELVFRVNDESRQRARTTDIMYDARALRRFVEPLSEGDVVLTGTPAGVALSVPRWKRRIADVLFDRWRKLAAAFRMSHRFLRPGDALSMDGGPLGTLRAIVEEDVD